MTTGLISSFSATVSGIVRRDDAGDYRCGRGMRSILQSLDIAHVEHGNTMGFSDAQQHGYRWATYLSSNEMKEQGWSQVNWQAEGWTPETSPPGVVWVYPRNSDRSTWNGKGAEFGHVELALGPGNGFASSHIFNNPGGSVRHNTPVAFVNDDLSAMIGVEGIVPEHLVYASLDRARNSLPSAETQESSGMAMGECFKAVSYSLKDMDLESMTFEEVIGALVNIHSGRNPNDPVPRFDSISDVSTPASTPGNNGA